MTDRQRNEARMNPAGDGTKPTESPAGKYTGFLLHTFTRRLDGKDAVCALGRLLDGRTFGLVERRMRPRFGLRRNDADKVERRLRQAGCDVEPWDWKTLTGESLVRVAHDLERPLRRLADELRQQGLPTYEADLRLHTLYRMDRHLTGPVVLRGIPRQGTDVDLVFVNPDIRPGNEVPSLGILSLDIETTPPPLTISAVSLVGDGGFGVGDIEEVHIVADPAAADPPRRYHWHSERDLLQAVARRIDHIDPDILTGWNVIDFDLRLLLERLAALHLPARLGRSRDQARFTAGKRYGASRVTLPGRQVLDALHLVRHTLARYEDFRLDTVARTILGRGKTLVTEKDDAAARIEHLRHTDAPAFAEYCLEDARLVRDILRREHLVELTQRRSILTGLPLDRAWGSIAAFEFLYIAHMHDRNLAAPTLDTDREQQGSAPGGLVLEPVPGLYRNILVFDFKSLYPSIMRTFNLDPYSAGKALATPDAACLTAPNGKRFAREQGILPGILDVFFQERQAAKQRGDSTASQAYKLVMNSFYGVLGTRACRFGSPALAGAITTFGQTLLRWCRDWFQTRNCTVIYGDTDSLFVAPDHLDDADLQAAGIRLCALANQALATHLRDRYHVTSQLELEFEKAYEHFLLPHARGSQEKGRAKGYAGLRRQGDSLALEIVGMEAVRSDWTDMAHAFQRNLLHKLFADTDPGEIENFVGDWVRALLRGTMDEQLVYRRRLRRELASYTSTTPPHVKAARLLDSPGRTIRYVITTAGPQPVEAVTAALDYGHYIDKQIRPLLEMVAPYRNIDVDAAIRGQQRLFRLAPAPAETPR